jgi:glycosyltransferase involved in cell wall biosynthesis
MTDITVVMATWKQPEYLLQSMLSIVPQVPHPSELRIVSVLTHKGRLGDDETIDMLEDWFELFFPLTPGRMIWCNEREPNIWKQRQRGLNDTKTPYICFFDSDDVMLPGWLDKGLKVAEEISSRGKIPIVGPSYRMVDEKLRPIQDVIMPEFSMDKMMNGCIIPDFSITTTEALRSVGGFFDPDGFDPGHPYFGYSMWLRVLKKYGSKVEVKLLSDIGFLYRQHKKAMHHRFAKTKRKSQENVRRQREIARHYFSEGVR